MIRRNFKVSMIQVNSHKSWSISKRERILQRLIVLSKISYLMANSNPSSSMTKKSMKLTITKTKNETSNDSLNYLSYLMKFYNLKQNKKLKRNMEANHLHEQINKVKDE